MIKNKKCSVAKKSKEFYVHKSVDSWLIFDFGPDAAAAAAGGWGLGGFAKDNFSSGDKGGEVFDKLLPPTLMQKQKKHKKKGKFYL